MESEKSGSRQLQQSIRSFLFLLSPSFGDRRTSTLQHLANPKKILTHVNVDPVPPLRHRLHVVPEEQLPERGKSSGPHPDLEVLVGSEIRELGVAVGVLGGPVGRRADV